MQLPLPADWGMLFVQSLPPCTKREQHGAAHALLEAALPVYNAEHGLSMPDTPLQLSYGDAGKPSLTGCPGVHFNLSHCEGLVACLLTDCACGVDAEPIRQLRPRVADRVCSEAERRAIAESEQPDLLFTRLWTLKEAYVKAIGIGISYPMRTVCFFPGTECIVSNHSESAFAQFLLPGHVVSVCLQKPIAEQPVYLTKI